MATSAFKSTTKRTPIGTKSSSDDSSSSAKAHRRSRSLSRFSHHLPESDFRDAPAPRGKFVNTIRGSGFPEISLDDLAVEFFPLNSKLDDEPETDRRRLSRRSSEISPASNNPPASQRRGRSVSRQNARASDGKSGVCNNSNDANLRRRRSVSVARCRISDSESDIDHSQTSSNHANTKNTGNGHNRMSSQKPISDRRLGRSYSQTDMLRSHDGYSSHSSALTDDEAKDAGYGRKDVEKTIRAVYAQKKAEHPIGEDVNGGLYQAMRNELRYVVEEIRTELEQAIVKGNSTLASGDSLKSIKADDQAVSTITKNYATKLEQSEKRKQDLLAEILLEEQRSKELSKIVKDLLPRSKSNTIEQKPLRTRKRSNDKNRVSKRLTEEAEKYFEDFISNVEDTDFSSIDGERSDASSSFGGISKQSEATPHCVEKTEGNQGRAGYNSRPVEMDGVVLPWLQWETSNDGSPLPIKTKTELPATPKTLLSDAAQDLISMQDSSGQSSRKHESWSPAVGNHSINSQKDVSSKKKEVESFQRSRFDMDEYLAIQRNEELFFERWRERDRISSGGLLLCGNHL